MKILLLFMSVLLLSNISTAKSCFINKSAIDIGSGTTKFLVASIDKCQKKIIKILYDEKVPTPFNENLEKSGQHQIDSAFALEQVNKLKPHIAQLKTFKVGKIKAVATSAFRMASNGQLIAQLIAKALNIQIQVIDQETEAKLGYQSALLSLGFEPSPQMVVWDIGGGSMQMYNQDLKSPHVYIGQLASVSFKNFLIEVFMGKNLNELSSPNPMKAIERQSIQFAESYARIHVPARFKEILPQATVIGVGGVFNQSVANQLNKSDQFNLKDIEDLFQVKAKMSDDQLNGNYKTTDISNLALVIGFMRALKVQKLLLANASLNHGLLFQ